MTYEPQPFTPQLAEIYDPVSRQLTVMGESVPTFKRVGCAPHHKRKGAAARKRRLDGVKVRTDAKA